MIGVFIWTLHDLATGLICGGFALYAACWLGWVMISPYVRAVRDWWKK